MRQDFFFVLFFFPSEVWKWATKYGSLKKKKKIKAHEGCLKILKYFSSHTASEKKQGFSHVKNKDSVIFRGIYRKFYWSFVYMYIYDKALF